MSEAEQRVEPTMDESVGDVSDKQLNGNKVKSKKAFLDVLLNAGLPMIWGAVGAGLVVFALNQFQHREEEPVLKLATVDIAKIMQEFNERVLRNPNDPSSVNFALEDSARAAQAVDPLLKYLSTEVHPGYTLIQPQALAYQGGILDFTDEFRVLLQKRMGKYNKDLESFVTDGGGDPTVVDAPVVPAPTAVPLSPSAPPPAPATAIPEPVLAQPQPEGETQVNDKPAAAKP